MPGASIPFRERCATVTYTDAARWISFENTDPTNADEPGQVTVMVPAGRGKYQQIVVNVDGSDSNAYDFHYYAPTMTAVTETATGLAPHPPTEGQTITIDGSDFGTGGTASLTLGPSMGP